MEQARMVDPIVDPTPAASTDPLWKRRGFADEAAFEAAFEQYGKDVPEMRRKLRESQGIQSELETLRAEKQQREDAQKTEAERERARAAALEQQLAAKDAELAQRGRDILYERELSKRLNTLPEEVREVIRDSYDKAVTAGFADEAELKSLLDAAQQKWEPIIARVAGGQPGPGLGISRGVPPTPTPAGKNPYADVMGRDLSSLQRDMRNERR